MLTHINCTNNHKNVAELIFLYQQLDYLKKNKPNLWREWQHINIITQQGYGNIKGKELLKLILIS
jgi:cellobiose-specific phosphotransferase system component IIB